MLPMVPDRCANVSSLNADEQRVQSAPHLPPRIESALMAEEEGGPGLLSLGAVLHAFRRKWLLVLLLGLLVGGSTAAASWFSQRPVYQSSAIVRIASRPTTLVFTTADQSSTADFELFRKTQRELILTQFLLNSALNREEVAKLPVVREQINPVEWLRSQLRITFPGDSELMQISLSGPEKRALPLLVNAVVDAYKTDVVDVERNQSLQRLNEMGVLEAQRENQLRTLRADVEAISESLGTGNEGAVSLTERSVLQQLTSYQAELGRVELALLKANTELAPLSRPSQGVPPAAVAPPDPSAASELVSEFDLEAALQADPDAGALRNQILRRTSLMGEFQAVATPATAEKYTKKYQSEIEKLEKQLAEHRERLRDRLVLMRLREQQRSEKELQAGLGREIAILVKQRDTLAKHVQQLEKEVARPGKKSIDLELKRSEIQSAQEILNEIKEERQHTQIELNSNSRIRIISRAVEPTAPNPLAALPLAVAAGLFGLFLPTALIVFWDVRKQFVSSSMQVANFSDIPILGQVPHVSARVQRLAQNGGVRHRELQDHLRETIDAVAARFIRWSERRQTKVIMVTSAIAGEGKTTLASQLAVSLADAGYRTLLVDFDLRRPKLHDVFGQELEPGVGNLLDVDHGDSGELWKVLKTLSTENLTLLPAGHCPNNTLTMLSNERLQRLFAQLKSSFHFVVVDSSPILQSVDARLIGQHVDGVVFSLLRDVSRMSKVLSAYELLAAYEIPVLGTVLLGTHSDVYSHRRRPPLIVVEDATV